MLIQLILLTILSREISLSLIPNSYKLFELNSLVNKEIKRYHDLLALNRYTGS
jgi:hypothetical protein